MGIARLSASVSTKLKTVYTRVGFRLVHYLFKQNASSDIILDILVVLVVVIAATAARMVNCEYSLCYEPMTSFFAQSNKTDYKRFSFVRRLIRKDASVQCICDRGYLV